MTTSSGQGDKSKTEISIDSLIKSHYPKAKFIGFVDGIGWYVRKGDQISEMFYQFQGEDDEFRALCQELGIQLYEYPLCAYCGKVIYGSSTWGDKGSMCWECKELTNENEKSIIKHDE